MKPLSLILITAFLSLNLCARDIIKDSEFKKEDKYWHLHKNNEYKNVEPKFKRGSVSFEISHTSEHFYICFLTEAPVKEGKTYQVSFKFKGKGQGKVYLTQRNYPNVFKGKRFDARKDKLINLGLVQSFEPKEKWQQATCTFVAKESPQSHLIEALIFMMGTYQGELTISDLTYTEVKDSSLSPNANTGSLEISPIK